MEGNKTAEKERKSHRKKKRNGYAKEMKRTRAPLAVLIKARRNKKANTISVYKRENKRST